jgi:hypothetical protein
MKRHTAKEVKTGEWLYDNQTPMTVKIFVLNFDYNYEIAKADGQLDEGEKPELNEEGEIYMIKWGSGDFFDNDLVTKDWGGFDLNAAIKKAQTKVNSKINWKDNS